MVIFKTKQKKFEGHLKRKLYGKRLYTNKIYFAIFESYLSYYCLVWAQNCNTIQCNFTKKNVFNFNVFNVILLKKCLNY